MRRAEIQQPPYALDVVPEMGRRLRRALTADDANQSRGEIELTAEEIHEGGVGRSIDRRGGEPDQDRAGADAGDLGLPGTWDHAHGDLDAARDGSNHDGRFNADR